MRIKQLMETKSNNNARTNKLHIRAINQLHIILAPTAEALENIALNKFVQYCEDKNLTKKIVDGITEAGKNDEVIETKCRGYDFIEINLGTEYLVHFVVVYEGIRANEGCRKTRLC